MSKLYIDKSVLKYMENEIKKVKNKNIETGGIILGKNKEGGNIFITHIIDGGYKASRKRGNFKKDIKYSQKIVDKIYKMQGFYYIGDWHTHPNNCLLYSETDSKSMKEICKLNKGYKMIFIIAGNDINLPFKVYTYNINNNTIEEVKYEFVEDLEKSVTF